MNERTPKKITAAVLAAVLAVGSVPATTLATTVAAFAADTESSTPIAVTPKNVSTYIDSAYGVGTAVNIGETSYRDLAPVAAASGNKIKVKFAEGVTSANAEAVTTTETNSTYKVPFAVSFKVDGVTDISKFDFKSGYGWDGNHSNDTEKQATGNFRDGVITMWFDAAQKVASTTNTNCWNDKGEHEVVFTYDNKDYSVVIVNDLYDGESAQVPFKVTAPTGATVTVKKEGAEGNLAANAKVSPFDKLEVTVTTEAHRRLDTDPVSVGGVALAKKDVEGNTFVYTVPADVDANAGVEFKVKDLIQTAGVTYTASDPSGNGNLSIITDKGATVNTGDELDVGTTLVITPTAADDKVLDKVTVKNGADERKITDNNDNTYSYKITKDDTALTIAVASKSQVGVTYSKIIENGTVAVYKLNADKDGNLSRGDIVNTGDKVDVGQKLEVVVTPNSPDTQKIGSVTGATKGSDGKYTVEAAEGSPINISATIRNKKKVKLGDPTLTEAAGSTVTVSRGGVALAKDAEILEDDELTITVSPAARKKITAITFNGETAAQKTDENGTPIENTYTYTVPEGITDGNTVSVAATFATIGVKVLSFTNPANGTITVTKTGDTTPLENGATIDEDTELTIEVKAIGDFKVTGVTAAGATLTEVTANSKYTLTVGAGDITLSATTAPLKKPAVTIASTDGGTIEVMNGTETVANNTTVLEGSKLTITATPGENRTLTSITVNGTTKTAEELKTTNGVFEFVVPDQEGAIAVSAVFGTQATITINDDIKDKVVITKGDGSAVNNGDNVASGTVLTVTEKPGFKLSDPTFTATSFAGAVGSPSRNSTYTVKESDKAITINATIVDKPADEKSTATMALAVTKGALTVTKNGEDVYNGDTVVEADVLKFTVTPGSGNDIRKITVNGTKLKLDDKYSAEYTVPAGVASTLTVTADCKKIVDVTVGTLTNGSIVVKNEAGEKVEKAIEGDVLTLEVTPDAGYKITDNSVKVNNGSPITAVSEKYTYTVQNADTKVEVTAAFEAKASGLLGEATVKLAEAKDGTFIVKNSENDVTDGATVKEADKLTIAPEAAKGFKVKAVKVGDTVVEADADGKYVYTVAAADKDKELAISVEFEGIAPAAVTDIKNTVRGYNALTFTWTASENADSYAVSYKTGDGEWSEAKTVTETTAKVEGLNPNTDYTVRIVAMNGAVEGEEATVNATTKASAKLTIASATNGKITVTRQDGKVLKTGNAITEGIKITIKPEANANYQIDKVTANGKELTANANGEYVYTVEKVDAFTVSATFKVSAPAAVTGIKATKTGYNSATVTWNKSAVATKYEVSYKTATGSWSAAKTVTGTTASLTGLTANTAYTVRVVAANDAGKSASATGAVTTKASPKITFTAPKNGKYTVTRDADKKVLKSGCNVTEGLGLTIKPTANRGYKIGVVRANGVTLTANANGEYKFNVPKSNAFSISVTFTATAPAKATGIKVTKSGYNALTVGWNKVANATKYEVSFKTANGSWSKTQTVTGISAKLSGLTANTKYTVRVIAVNGTVKGAAATANVATKASPRVTITAPKNGKVVLNYPNRKQLKNGAHITEGLVLNIKPTANKGYKVAKVVVNGREVKANARGQYLYTVPKTNALKVTVTFSK